MIGDALHLNFYLYLLLPAAFLIGSIPFGLIFTRNKGIDIRETGSKNIGATNVLRSAGKMPAVMTLLADLLKGAVPVFVTGVVVAKLTEGHEIVKFSLLAEDVWTGMAGLAAVLGHMFSIFLQFRGGKGVATGFGVLIVISPVSAFILLLVWIVVVNITKYVSIGSIVAVCLLPLVYLLQGASMVKVIFGVVLAVLITFKHSSNISKLVAGTESKIGKIDAGGKRKGTRGRRNE
jgi:glycerol-3-phosphate acyltransferase PlsY